MIKHRNQWEKIGPKRYPLQYWTNELYNYFKYKCEMEEVLERFPIVDATIAGKAARDKIWSHRCHAAVKHENTRILFTHTRNKKRINS